MILRHGRTARVLLINELIVNRPTQFSSVTLAVCLFVLGLLASPNEAGAQQPPPATSTSKSPQWLLTTRDTARAEVWRFFQPNPGGGNPDYEFLANRLNIDAKRTTARTEVTVGLQHVGFVGLPTAAVGPGPLGTGALYFDQGGRSQHPSRLFVRYANLKVKDVLPGFDLQAGRMAYGSGAESVTTDAKLELVRRQRVSARLVGEFDWSLYQRSFDGVRVDLRRPRWQLTSMVMQPTHGGFSSSAGQMMPHVLLAGAVVTARPAKIRASWQVFAIHYADSRRMASRPDNSGATAARVDVDVTSSGGAWIGTHKTTGAGGGEFDGVVWLAGQTGSWYGQRHRAWSLTAEGGYQLNTARWKPWLRAGLLSSSGDADGQDARHGTFFPVLPTMRKFSQTTMYSTMNLHDAFVQLQLRPSASVNARIDVHRLALASAADLWYTGSGATLASGTNFGFAGRRSNGSTNLGTSLEGSIDYAVTPQWSVNAFAARMNGGPVVSGTFAGRRLWFVYLESVLRFDWRR